MRGRSRRRCAPEASVRAPRAAGPCRRRCCSDGPTAGEPGPLPCGRGISIRSTSHGGSWSAAVSQDGSSIATIRGGVNSAAAIGAMPAMWSRRNRSASGPGICRLCGVSVRRGVRLSARASPCPAPASSADLRPSRRVAPRIAIAEIAVPQYCRIRTTAAPRSGFTLVVTGKTWTEPQRSPRMRNEQMAQAIPAQDSRPAPAKAIPPIPPKPVRVIFRDLASI